jgi:hypothetical protein
MTPLTRSLIPAAALAALTVFVTGCGSTSSGTAAAALSSTAPPVPASASAATPVPSRAISAPSASGSLRATSPSAPVAASTAAALTRAVYLAEGGSVGATVLRAPACKAGCQLSGDSTTSLWDMTWPAWNPTDAVGTGTEKLDDCTPDCAAGTLHAVPVRVTLSRPVMVCVSGTGRWFWTRVSFTWPAGLPAVFSGGNAPLNPFDYPGITAQAAKECR